MNRQLNKIICNAIENPQIVQAGLWTGSTNSLKIINSQNGLWTGASVSTFFSHKTICFLEVWDSCAQNGAFILLFCPFWGNDGRTKSASPINSKVFKFGAQFILHSLCFGYEWCVKSCGLSNCLCVFRFMGVEQDVAVPGRRGASAALQYVTGWDPGKAHRRWKRHPVLSQSGAHHCPSQRGTSIYSVFRIWTTCLFSIVISVCVVVQFISSFASWVNIVQVILRLLLKKSQLNYT